jgi:hypothetical protein
MEITQETKKPYNRIPEIDIPEFNPRTIWVSDDAQRLWQPRFSRISNAYLDVERHNVESGFRESYLTPVQTTNLFDMHKWADDRGLELVMLGKEGTSTASYSSKSKSYEHGNPFTVRCSITLPKNRRDWIDAWNLGDNETIGRLLGYPKCCRDWFKYYWQDNQWIDDILPMYENGGYSSDGPWQLNFFYRYMGARLVSHMPCSFNCEESLEIAKHNHNLMKELGYVEEAEWIEEIFNWPVRWSSLHGIAEIRCPIFKLSHKTDFLAEEFIVDKDGDRYPEEGASGLHFPWKRFKKAVTITENRSFTESLKDPKMWEDNGFGGEKSMNACHQQILEVLSSFKVGSIIDLGSGNGLLLKRISERGDMIDTFGIEMDEGRYFRGLSVHPDGIFRKGNMFDYGNYTENYYNMVLLMPGRLLEMPENERNTYIQFLKDRTDNILLYIYGDWIQKYNNDMVQLLNEVGLNVKIKKAVKHELVHIILGDLI